MSAAFQDLKYTLVPILKAHFLCWLFPRSNGECLCLVIHLLFFFHIEICNVFLEKCVGKVSTISFNSFVSLLNAVQLDRLMVFLSI